MFLHSGETSAIVAPTLAKEPLMKTAPKKSIRPMPRPSEERMGALRDRADEAAKMKRLESLMTDGTEAKALEQDYKATQEDLKAPKKPGIRVTGSGGKKIGADLKPMVKKAGGGMVMGYKNGGCVMAGRGGKYKGAM
jgi:hypothetical protein